MHSLVIFRGSERGRLLPLLHSVIFKTVTMQPDCRWFEKNAIFGLLPLFGLLKSGSPSVPPWRGVYFLKDEFLDVIYWFRQIIAVVLGVIWGVLPLRGFLGIAGFCLINAGVLYLYFSNYLQIDEEEYGGTWELTKEGFMTSFALFMVIWIIFYTAIHYD